MLTDVVGEVLPLTLVIAISPLVIVAVILMLLSPSALRTSSGFLLGWTIGNIIPIAVFVLIAGVLPPQQESGGPDVVRATVQFILAFLLLLLAVRQWRARPAADEEPVLPKWMAAIDSFTFGRALGLGLLLSLPRPKSLVVAANAGMIIGASGLTVSAEIIATALFVLCAVSTVLIPVLVFVFAAERLRAPLQKAREWLVRENTTITTVLLAVIAVHMIGNAIGSL